MSVEVESVEQVSADGLPGKLKNQSYELPAGLSFGEWQRAGLSLRFMLRNINWHVGDWLVYGEASYGEEAFQATMSGMAEMLGREADSVGQCHWVASRFPPSTRVSGLSWSHHRAVLIAGLTPEQGQDLLQQALGEDDGKPWTVIELSERAAEWAAALEGKVSGASSEPDEDGDVLEDEKREWLPGAEDLRPEVRTACESYARQAKIKPLVMARAWALALFWSGSKDAFSHWED